MKKLFLITLMGILVIFLIFGSQAVSAPSKVIELSFNHHMPPGGISEQEWKNHWAKPIEERTNGRVKITFHGGAVLSKPQDAFQAAVGGIADISWFWHAHTPGRFPLLTVFDLPLWQPLAEGNNKAMLNVYKKFPQIKAEHAGTKVLWIISVAGYSILSKKPVRTLEDFKGMKVRSPGNAALTVKALGGTPILMPMPAAYQALQKQVVDATMTHWIPVSAFRLFEVTKYAIGDYFAPGTMGLVMNLGKWNSLPKDIQKIIDEVSIKFWHEQPAREDANDRKSKELWIKKGCEIIPLSPAEEKRWKKLCDPLFDKWVDGMEAKGLPGREVLDEVLRTLEAFKASH